MSDPVKKEDKMAQVAKQVAEDKEGAEMRNTLFAAKGKSTVPAKAPVTEDKYREDVLRRVNRRHLLAVSESESKDKTVVEQGHVITVTMPNHLKVRLTLDDNVKPVPETITREHIVRWEAVA